VNDTYGTVATYELFYWATSLTKSSSEPVSESEVVSQSVVRPPIEITIVIAIVLQDHSVHRCYTLLLKQNLKP
jgi:hypothetical protein